MVFFFKIQFRIPVDLKAVNAKYLESREDGLHIFPYDIINEYYIIHTVFGRQNEKSRKLI